MTVNDPRACSGDTLSEVDIATFVAEEPMIELFYYTPSQQFDLVTR